MKNEKHFINEKCLFNEKSIKIIIFVANLIYFSLHYKLYIFYLLFASVKKIHEKYKQYFNLNIKWS